MAKVFYASPKDVAGRIPELRPLNAKTVVVVGLGTLGAPSVLEFARAGVGCIRMIDHDIVDASTTVRWPLGFTAAGHKKVVVLNNFIERNYPYTQCEVFDFRIGAPRDANSSKPPQQAVIADIFAEADVIYDCTAELGVQHFLTDWAWKEGVLYVGVSGTLGGWGGKVFRIRGRRGTGCWCCYRKSCQDGAIPEPPGAQDDQGTVQTTGCADLTFTGAGFDMLQVALAGVRMVVSTLC